MTITTFSDWQPDTSEYTAALMPGNQLYVANGCLTATSSAQWHVIDFTTGLELSVDADQTPQLSKLYYSVECANSINSNNLVQLTHDSLDSIMATPYKPIYYVVIIIAIYCIFRSVYKVFFR